MMLGLPVVPPMMLAMPPELSGATLSKDGRSIISKVEGWVFTSTPTIVK
jgi:hypothetical protein